jgi:hypothetical protein
MVVHEEIVKLARILGGRDNVHELHTVDLEVIAAILHNFKKLIEHLTAKATRATVMKEKPESSKTQLRKKHNCGRHTIDKLFGT